jgi:hypothetical protein
MRTKVENKREEKIRKKNRSFKGGPFRIDLIDIGIRWCVCDAAVKIGIFPGNDFNSVPFIIEEKYQSLLAHLLFLNFFFFRFFFYVFSSWKSIFLLFPFRFVQVQQPNYSRW